jgi:hypothetical protein
MPNCHLTGIRVYTSLAFDFDFAFGISVAVEEIESD